MPRVRAVQRGFTLIELVMVLLLVSALSLFALPKFFQSSEFERYAFHKELLAAVRYAQKTAIASGCDVRVSVSAATDSYALSFRDGGTDTSCGGGAGFNVPVPHPAESGAFSGSAPTGVDITDGLSLHFDAVGRPGTGDSLTVGGLSVVVESQTGYVHE